MGYFYGACLGWGKKVLQNVQTHLLALQGSYGVVKLAYNEDSEQYYVSFRRLHSSSPRSLFIVAAWSPWAFPPCVQAMKVVSKKKLMRQHGFLRRWKKQTMCRLCSRVRPGFAPPLTGSLPCWLWFQAACRHRRDPPRSKPRCPWRRSTERSPSWRNWTITM